MFPAFYELFEDVVERLADVPLGVMRFHFRKIADVADVIAFAILLFGKRFCRYEEKLLLFHRPEV